MIKGEKDIFEELARKCGCMYVSDLRSKYFRGAALYFLDKESFTKGFDDKHVAEAKAYVSDSSW